jgi:hypothetical protein
MEDSDKSGSGPWDLSHTPTPSLAGPSGAQPRHADLLQKAALQAGSQREREGAGEVREGQLLADPECAQESDRWIADAVRVSRPGLSLRGRGSRVGWHAHEAR